MNKFFEVLKNKIGGEVLDIKFSINNIEDSEFNSIEKLDEALVEILKDAKEANLRDSF